MRCALCNTEIEKYDPAFNHLIIDGTHDADICQGCIDLFLKWQQGIFAHLFPTAASKKMYEKR
ncbi:hypothetical protein COV93_06385 [Candidatus Woesearchaeota archaeon CG11_big_fil_rev_8_21_14_0_20_43_8]|nr:MAG: hypothetical protein COV93_06385 [Candidatus Woesearchaeota archaeon CG11_big_fil_rev_8_21_14_0_20_43_8]